MNITPRQVFSGLANLTMAGAAGLISLTLFYMVVELITPVADSAIEYHRSGDLGIWFSSRFRTAEHIGKFLIAIFLLVVMSILALFSGVISKVFTSVVHDELKEIVIKQL